MAEPAPDTGKPTKRRVGRPKGSKNGPNAGKNGNPVGRPRKNPPKAATPSVSPSATKQSAEAATKDADPQGEMSEPKPKKKKKGSSDGMASTDRRTPETGDETAASSASRNQLANGVGVSRAQSANQNQLPSAEAPVSVQGRRRSHGDGTNSTNSTNGPDNDDEHSRSAAPRSPPRSAACDASSEVQTPHVPPADESARPESPHEPERATDLGKMPKELVAELDATVSRSAPRTDALPQGDSGRDTNDTNGEDDEIVILVPSALQEEDPASEAVPSNTNTDDTCDNRKPINVDEQHATAQGEAARPAGLEDEPEPCEDEDDDFAMEDEFRDPCDDDEDDEGPTESAGPSAGPSNVPAPEQRPAGMKSFFCQQQSGKHELRSTIPTWLEEDYKETCVRLKDKMKNGYKKWPACYQASTFWDTGKNLFFASLMQFQLNPRLFYCPHYFVWFPHLFQRIPCPACLSVNRRMKKNCALAYLTPHTLPKRPRRVYDITDDHIYIIAVLNMLPPSLTAQFTFHLTHRSGLTDDLAALLCACFQRGMGPSPFADMIRTFHIWRYEQLLLQYLQMVHSWATAVESNLIARHMLFGDWDDPTTFGGSVPSANYFRMFYIHSLEKRAGVLDQVMAMLSAHYLCIDHSFKVIKHLGKVNGAQIFSTLLSAVNEYGECRSMTLTMTKAHDQSMPALSQIPHSTQKYRHNDTEIIFTDSPRADKAELECIFLALLWGVEPVLSSSLKQLCIPEDWDIYVLSSVWVINLRLQTLLDDARHLPSGSTFSLAMDMEWPVDHANGIQGRIAVITIAFDQCVYVIPVSPYTRPDGSLNLPNMLLVLLQSERIIKYGVHIKADFMRLFHDCGLAGKLASYQRANVSLVDLTARILCRSLLKETSICISTRWDELPLSKDQIDYAALDAYASWKLYEALHARAGVPSGVFVSLSTPVGTHVKLLSCDHTSVIAYGVLSADHPLKFDGVNMMPTQALVNVTAVLMPAYLMWRKLLKSKQATPLSELIASGLPCAVLCCLKDLQTCIGEEAKTVPRPQAQSGQLPSCLPIQPVEPYSDPTLLEPEPGVSSLAPSDDEKADYDAEQEQKLEDSTADPQSAERAQTLSALLDVPEGAYRSSPVHSRQVRRHVPPPEELAPHVLAILQMYGPMKDAVTGQPLFNDATFEAIPPALENLQKGYYSDPPDIPMYMTRGKDANSLTLYRCVRGTNNVEGGIHQNLAKHIGSYNTSPRFARNLLHDYCYHHNARVGTLNRTEVPYKHSFDIWTLNCISELQDQTSHLFVNHAKQPLRGWVNGNHYEPSTKHFGILPLSPAVWHKLGMLEYNATHATEMGIRHADLASQQGTRFAVLPIHTSEERAFYRILVQKATGHFCAKDDSQLGHGGTGVVHALRREINILQGSSLGIVGSFPNI
ncbi:hypothetical protein EWM64_g5507 [Hericium alpestre]|uniref:3'-5' exonuclease n=1 Tax=Hericium alpestre TaxID=135208 RepID=A0A4Y9ZVA8_9AGAM|nr:hypothetical protein EWM64_g5507 [Hericium alpestre]